jgi:hypothetical protein
MKQTGRNRSRANARHVYNLEITSPFFPQAQNFKTVIPFPSGSAIPTIGLKAMTHSALQIRKIGQLCMFHLHNVPTNSQLEANMETMGNGATFKRHTLSHDIPSPKAYLG